MKEITCPCISDRNHAPLNRKTKFCCLVETTATLTRVPDSVDANSWGGEGKSRWQLKYALCHKTELETKCYVSPGFTSPLNTRTLPSLSRCLLELYTPSRHGLQRPVSMFLQQNFSIAFKGTLPRLYQTEKEAISKLFPLQ